MSGWETDDYATRMKFLRAFHRGLSIDDEPFLEACLDDSRREIREQAQSLLQRLPGSQLVQRMIEQATPLLNLTKSGIRRKPAIEVTYPAKLSADMQRDGVKPWKKGARFEEDAYYLYQMLLAIPPTFWCEHWGISAEDLYAAMMNSPESDLLLHAYAWTDAGDYARGSAFSVVLINHQLERFDSLALGPLIQDVSAEMREAVALKWLQKYNDGLKNIQIVGPLLAYHRVMWSDELSRAFLASLDRYLNKGKVRPPRGLYEILKNAAAHMSPALRPEIMRVLETETSAEKLWIDLIDEIRLLLDFRQEMLTAIHSVGD
jgi:hypothetical protein